MVTQGEGKEDTPKCQWKTERRIMQVVWSNGVTNAEVRQRTNVKDIVTLAHSVKEGYGVGVGRNFR
jgi:hypothetical protein